MLANSDAPCTIPAIAGFASAHRAMYFSESVLLGVPMIVSAQPFVSARSFSET